MKYSKCRICGGHSQVLVKNLFDDRYGAPRKYDIYQCANCGFGRTYPELGRKEIGKFYKKYYPLSLLTPKQVKDYAKIPSMLSSWLLGTNNTTHWYVRKGADVLDVGSGSGVSLLEIKRLGASAFGVEPDPSAQKLAKKLKFDVYEGFITDSSFPRKKFDFITGSQVIEHEPKPEEFLFAALKKLKPGGLIILAFPNIDSLYRRIFSNRWINWHVPYHVNHFSRKSFIILVNRVGLKVKKIKTITPNLWTIIQLRSISMTPKYGYPSPIWGRTGTNNKIDDKKSRLIINYLIHFLGGLLSYLVIPINRMVDSLGYGESFLVWLEKK